MTGNPSIVGVINLIHRDRANQTLANVGIAVNRIVVADIGQGKATKRWRHNLDQVGGVRVETTELVNPTAIGGGATAVAVDAPIKIGVDAQVNFDATQVRLAHILKAVKVTITPDAVAETDLPTLWGQTSIHIIAVLAGVEHDRCGGRSGRIDIAIGIVIATLILRAEGESTGQVDADGVTTSGQSGKAIEATAVGRLRLHGVTTAILQRYQDICNAIFTSVLHAITIRIIPDAVANRAKRWGGRWGWRRCNDWGEASIDIVKVLTSGQVDRVGVAVDDPRGHTILCSDITVQALVTTQVGWGEDKGIGVDIGKAHDITTSSEVGKAIDATCIGCCGPHGIARAITQDHADVGNAIFASVLHAITIRVIPDAVTNRAKRRGGRIGWGGRWRNWLIDTGINVGQILTSRQVDRITRRITDVDVAIQVAIRALRLRAELEATGQVNAHEVTAGSQASEAISTGTIGRDGTDKVAATA